MKTLGLGKMMSQEVFGVLTIFVGQETPSFTDMQSQNTHQFKGYIVNDNRFNAVCVLRLLGYGMGAEPSHKIQNY